jgi:hypothetical protein
MSDWNDTIVNEFRTNQGKVGGNFEGAPMILIHHTGRKSKREYVVPAMYLQHETDPDKLYVFASKGGAPTNPDWYYNLVFTGEERDTIYAEQVSRYPGFGDYEKKTAGIRTIPVLEFTRN